MFLHLLNDEQQALFLAVADRLRANAGDNADDLAARARVLFSGEATASRVFVAELTAVGSDHGALDDDALALLTAIASAVGLTAHDVAHYVWLAERTRQLAARARLATAR